MAVKTTEPVTDSSIAIRLQDIGSVIEFITKGLAGLVALGSIIYLLGAVVLAGRLSMYSLPSEIVINQLPQSLLIAIGLTEVVAPYLAVATIYVLTLFFLWELSSRVFPKLEGKAIVALEVVLWAVAALVVLLAARLGWHAAGGWLPVQAIVAGLLTALGAISTILVLYRFPRTIEAWHLHKANPLLRAAVVAAAMLPLIAWNAVTLPMPYAQVCPTKSIEKANGWLVGQANDHLLLGSTEKDTGQRHILVAPSQNAPIMVTYQDLKVAPLPACPAISSG